MLADQCRSEANILHSGMYNPHLTLAILRHASFPKMVTRKYHKRWQKRLIEDYLAINYLIDFANVMIPDDEFDLWAVNFETQNYCVFMEIKFWVFCKKILVLDVWTRKEKHSKLFEHFVRSSFSLSLDLYTFLL